MSAQVLFRPEAEADLSEAFVWYYERGQGLGAEFLRSVGAAVKRGFDAAVLSYAPMGYEHLNEAGPLTKKTLASLRFFEELDYRDFMHPSRASRSLPIVSCGYKHCSALVLAHPSALALSHMLTISGRDVALEYVDDMLDRLEQLLGSRPEGSDLSGLLIAGAGQDHILAACAARGIRTQAPHLTWDGGTRDVIVYPEQRRAEVYSQTRCIELKLG